MNGTRTICPEERGLRFNQTVGQSQRAIYRSIDRSNERLTERANEPLNERMSEVINT